MAKRHSGTAFVLVRKDWFNSASHILNDGKPSKSEEDVHFIMAPVENADDHRGLWLRVNTTTVRRRNDGAAVEMKFMIPWSAIVACGLADEKASVVGFTTTARRVFEPGA